MFGGVGFLAEIGFNKLADIWKVTPDDKVGRKYKLSDAVVGFKGNAYAGNLFPNNPKLADIATTVQKSIIDGTPPNKILKVIDDEIIKK